MIRLESPGDLQRAGVVARAYSLQDVTLAEFSARRARPYERETMPRIELKTDTGATAELRPDGKVLAVLVRFEVDATAGGTSDSTSNVKVAGIFALEYVRTTEGAKVDAASVDLFGRINGIYNAWPYIREVVSNAFSRLGYPRLTLEPLLINPRPPEAPSAKPKHAPPSS